MSDRLRGRRGHEISLPGAMEACGHVLRKAIAMLYAPQKCYLARMTTEAGKPTLEICEGGVVRQLSDAEAFAALSVFEARAFNDHCELRWVQECGNSGTAVLLVDDDTVDLDNVMADAIPQLNAIAIRDHTYLLWGRAQPDTVVPGWLRLTEARIGSIWVPLSPLPLSPADLNGSPKCRVRVRAREYFCQYEYGNAAVAEERLLGLEVIS